MLDAVTLANWLSTLRFAVEGDIEKVFQEYHAERYLVAKAAYNNSLLFTRNLGKVMSRRCTIACVKLNYT